MCHAKKKKSEQGLSSHTVSSLHILWHHKRHPTENEGIFCWEEHTNVCCAPVKTGYECNLQAVRLSHTSILRGSATLKLLSAPLRSSSPLSDSPRYTTTCELEGGSSDSGQVLNEAESTSH